MSQSKLHFLQTASLFLVLIIDAMGMGLILPLLGPLFVDPLGGMLASNSSVILRDLMYALTISSFAFFMFFGAPFLGDLSDHLGRKKVLMLCLFGTAFGSLLSAFGIIIKSLVLLIAGRSIAGFMCGSQALAQAAIVDMSTPENKARNLGFISFASCVGFALGPYVSGVLTAHEMIVKFGFIMPFIAAGLLSFLNAGALLFTFKETFYPKPIQRLHLTKGLDVFISAFINKKIRSLAIIYLLAEGGWALYFQCIPLYLIKNFKYTSTQIGHVMGYMGVIFGITLLWLIRICTKHLTARQICNYSFLSCAVGFFMVLLNTEWSVWFGAIPACVGGALFYVALLTLFSNVVDADSQGWVMGVFAAVAAFSWTIGGFLTGTLFLFGLFTPFIIAGSLMLLSYCLLFVDKSITN